MVYQTDEKTNDVMVMLQNRDIEIASLRKKLDAYEHVKVMVGDKEYTLVEAYKRFLGKLTTEMDINTDLHNKMKEIEEVIMPNGDNSNPCMKCGSIQCARCGVDILNEFNKIKKKFTHKEA